MALAGASKALESFNRESLARDGKQWSAGMAILVARWGESGLMEQVCEDMLEGVSFQRCAENRGIKQGELARWIMADEQREREWEALLRVRSDLMMYETLDIADATDPEFVGVSKLRIEQRNKLASKWFKPRYGDDSKVNVNIGGGSLVAILASLPVGMRPGDNVINTQDTQEQELRVIRGKVERVVEAEIDAKQVDMPEPTPDTIPAEQPLNEAVNKPDELLI